MQSCSVANFKLYKVDRHITGDLHPHIKGAAFWDKVDGTERYYVFDHLSRTPLPVKYDEGSHQWVFIAIDTRTRNWIATDTAPQAFRLGRKSIRHSTVWAAEVDKEETFAVELKEEKPSNVLSSMITDNNNHLAMSQTMAVLTLAGMATTGSQFAGFSRKGKGPAFLPYVPGSGGGPSGSGLGGPQGGDPPGGGGGLPGGGGYFPMPRPGAAAGGGGGKLGGNPPRIFDRTHSEADAFMNEFNLYCLINIGVV